MNNILFESLDDFKLEKEYVIITESIDFKNINKDFVINKIKDAKNTITKLGFFKILLISYALSLGYTNLNSKFINREILNDKSKIETLSNTNDDEGIIEEVENVFSKIVDKFKSDQNVLPPHNTNILKNVVNMSVSENGKKYIKNHEGSAKYKGEPVLTAYKLGDGKITVGWGHAEKIRSSKIKHGQQISREKAELLFNKDLKVAENGIKRIFKEWKQNENLDIKISQNMFDALVSIAFNSGVQSVRNSNFIKDIKNKNFKEAAEKIRKFNISKKYPGLNPRRESESKLFARDIHKLKGRH